MACLNASQKSADFREPAELLRRAINRGGRDLFQFMANVAWGDRLG
jgi:hypothetical protein